MAAILDAILISDLALDGFSRTFDARFTLISGISDNFSFINICYSCETLTACLHPACRKGQGIETDGQCSFI